LIVNADPVLDVGFELVEKLSIHCSM